VQDQAQAPVLLTVPDVARRLGLSRSTVYDLITSRQLRSVKIGGARRVSVAALDEFVAALEADAS
jgi:excisionase family DNA binding protein